MTEHDDVVGLLHRAVDTTPAQDEQIAAIAAAARRHRRVRRAAAAVSVAAVLAIVFAVPWDARPNRIDLVDRPAAPADEAPVWTKLPQSPLDPRWGAFSAFSGDGLFVWGGYASAYGVAEGPRGDGAVYWDDRWSALPESPLAPRMRLNSVAGWIGDVRRDGATGDEYWIVGGTGGADGTTPLRDAAAYRPGRSREGRWYELPTVPEPIIGGTVVGGGTSMVAVAQGSDASRAVYELAPGDRQWRELEQSLPPADPSAVDNSDLHVLDAGGHVVIVGQGEMFVIANGLDQGVGLEWERVPPPEGARVLDNVRGAVADHARDAVVVLLPDGTYRCDLAAREWSRIAGGLRPDPPQPLPLVRTHDDTVVAVDVVGGRVHALAEDDEEWTALPPLDGSRTDAAVEVAEGTVAGFDDDGDEAAEDIVNSIVVWGGRGSEESGEAEGAMLPLRQDIDP